MNRSNFLAVVTEPIQSVFPLSQKMPEPDDQERLCSSAKRETPQAQQPTLVPLPDSHGELTAET